MTVEARHSKRRREDTLPLRSQIAAPVGDWIADRPDDRSLFPIESTHTAEMIRVDLEAAGIPYETASGVADFHSLRHTFVTMLAKRTAPVKVVQMLARHSTPTLTLGVYSHVGLDDQASALEALPSIDEIDGRASDKEPLAALLPFRGDGREQNLSRPVVIEDAAGEVQPLSGDLRNPSQEAGLISSCRPVSQPVERRGRDSNPRNPCGLSGFQDRPNRPLWHPSETVRRHRPRTRRRRRWPAILMVSPQPAHLNGRRPTPKIADRSFSLAVYWQHCLPTSPN